jgi:hypothetical protein
MGAFNDDARAKMVAYIAGKAVSGEHGPDQIEHDIEQLLEASLSRLRGELDDLVKYQITGRYGGGIAWLSRPNGEWIRAEDIDKLLSALTKEK